MSEENLLNNNTNYGTISNEPYKKLEDNEEDDTPKINVNENIEDIKQDISSNNNPSNTTVVVTGASGFVASHCIVLLLEKGYKVIGTVRSSPDSNKYSWLRGLDKTNGKQLKLVQANLLTDGSYDDCISNCDYVLHVASPYVLTPKDPMKDLVEPAVNGTNNVLNSCLKSKTLKKVVLTSSMAAITDEPVKVYTEKDWNQKSSTSRQPYYYSKVLGEKAGWDFHNKHKPSWGLVVINPWVVIGPELHPNKSINQSNKTVTALVNGEYQARVNLEFPIVDVRDVALGHIICMEDENAKGRHILANESWTFDALCNYLNELCDEYSLKNSIPSCLCNCNFCYCCLWCFMCFKPSGERDFVRTHLNKNIRFDNSKIKNMGLQFRDSKQSIKDTFLWARRAKIIG